MAAFGWGDDPPRYQSAFELMEAVRTITKKIEDEARKERDAARENIERLEKVAARLEAFAELLKNPPTITVDISEIMQGLRSAVDEK